MKDEEKIAAEQKSADSPANVPATEKQDGEAKKPVIVEPPSDIWEALAPDEPQEQSGPEPEPEPTADPELLSRAQEFGFSPDEARKLGSPEALRQALVLADRLIGRRLKSAGPEVPSTPTRDVQQPERASAGETQTDADEADLDPGVYDEGLVKAYAALKKRVLQMEAALRQVGSVATALEAQRTVARFDKAISALGDEYAELLGVGDTDDLDPKTEQYQNRLRVAMTVRALRNAYQDGAMQPPPLATLVKRAVAAEFSDTIRKKASEEGARRARDELGRYTNRPNGRTDSQSLQSADERALAALERKWRQIYGRTQ